MNVRYKIYFPVLFAMLIALGIFIGSKLNFSETKIKFLVPEKKASDKLNSVLHFIEEEYVDTVNTEALVEKAIDELLHNLDPHSAYISAAELKAVHEPLEGSFEGIGIEFNIIRDTIRVISAISGGPSEALGIQAGDKIVKIEGKNVAGVKIKNNDVLSQLRGKGGTKVSVSIQRGSSAKLIEYAITRGKIPIFSVDVGYMLDREIGYIKISRFAETTYDEFAKKASKLLEQGMKNLILDLRGNSGGLLSSAIKITDEFLEKGKVIVYTEGKAHPRETIYARKNGILLNTRLAILIDEGSASASEIVAGAIQDNDRGIIVGRRSFGKGLVQRETMFSDSSAIRLTVARYYTPTGRSIQKPYDKGLQEYYREEFVRFDTGELQYADSIHFSDSLKYITPGGKTVYGGGGIMPDVFVPMDTTGRTPYLTELFVKGIINRFAFEYSDKNRQRFNKMGFYQFQKTFHVSEKLFSEFLLFATRNEVKENTAQAASSKKIITTLLKASIARNIWHNEGFYPILNETDKTLLKAKEIIAAEDSQK